MTIISIMDSYRTRSYLAISGWYTVHLIISYEPHRSHCFLSIKFITQNTIISYFRYFTWWFCNKVSVPIGMRYISFLGFLHWSQEVNFSDESTIMWSMSSQPTVSLAEEAQKPFCKEIQLKGGIGSAWLCFSEPYICVILL